jgi:periplasmic divalent cation tolerance protein
MDAIIFLYSTASDETVATAIADALVETGAAACVNIIPGMQSVYRWNGKIEKASECALIIKTTASSTKRAIDLIRERHPYKNPAIVSLVVDEALSAKEYCGWIRQSCMSG